MFVAKFTIVYCLQITTWIPLIDFVGCSSKMVKGVDNFVHWVLIVVRWLATLRANCRLAKPLICRCRKQDEKQILVQPKVQGVTLLQQTTTTNLKLSIFNGFLYIIPYWCLQLLFTANWRIKVHRSKGRTLHIYCLCLALQK